MGKNPLYNYCETLVFLKILLTVIFQSLLITAFKGNNMKSIKKYLLIVTASIAILSVCGLYLNIEYYLAHLIDATETKMVFFNLLEVIFTVYLLFAFSYKCLTYTEKSCIIILSLFIALTNCYYFVLDLGWLYNFISVVFWLSYNIIKVIYSIGIVIYISKSQNNSELTT